MLHDVLIRLSARLPELEWKLSLLGDTINPALLPRGLFRSRVELTSLTCVEEIKADIDAIKRQKNDTSVHYLAERVEKKINVLVRLCKPNPAKKTPERPVDFGVQAMGTRQQWLHTMRENIDALTMQHQALAESLVILQAENNTKAILSLQAELGKAERRLTLAKETLAKATTF